jgi:molybdopterin/thiamine biosynthesis adenylyltransferase
MNIIQAGRFKDALWYPKEESFTIVGGVGGIGSWLTLLLARAGFTPIIYDFDTFEEHNMSGQLVPKSCIGKTKVEVIAEVVKDFADTAIVTNNAKYTREDMSHHYVFSGFDNMKARKDMFESWCEYVKEIEDSDEVPIFIDGRLLMEQMQIFCVTPDRIEEYKKYLFTDEEIPEAPCTLKQTSHSATMIASHMVGFFTNHITNNVEKDTVRSVPFLWEYFIPLNHVNEVIC